MAGTIRARFAHGVLEHLDEGEVLTITIIRLPVKEGGGGLSVPLAAGKA